MPFPDLYEEKDIEMIAKTYETVREIFRDVAIYDSMLRNYDSERRISQKKSEFGRKLSKYDELVELYKKLPEQIRNFPLLRNVKSELDKKVQEVATKYGLVSAVSA